MIDLEPIIVITAISVSAVIGAMTGFSYGRRYAEFERRFYKEINKRRGVKAMAVIITKPGNLVPRYSGTCEKCKAEVAFDRSDAVAKNDEDTAESKYHGPSYWLEIHCPTYGCDGIIYAPDNS